MVCRVIGEKPIWIDCDDRTTDRDPGIVGRNGLEHPAASFRDDDVTASLLDVLIELKLEVGICEQVGGAVSRS